MKYEALLLSYLLQATAAYAKNWGHRERALREIHEQMHNLPPSETETSHNMLRASIPVINRALKDNVYSVIHTKEITSITIFVHH
jgi:hypothetical protein